jgi:hypothetical protein
MGYTARSRVAMKMILDAPKPIAIDPLIAPSN